MKGHDEEGFLPNECLLVGRRPVDICLFLATSSKSVMIPLLEVMVMTLEDMW